MTGVSLSPNTKKHRKSLISKQTKDTMSDDTNNTQSETKYNTPSLNLTLQY